MYRVIRTWIRKKVARSITKMKDVPRMWEMLCAMRAYSTYTAIALIASIWPIRPAIATTAANTGKFSRQFKWADLARCKNKGSVDSLPRSQLSIRFCPAGPGEFGGGVEQCQKQNPSGVKQYGGVGVHCFVSLLLIELVESMKFHRRLWVNAYSVNSISSDKIQGMI